MNKEFISGYSGYQQQGYPGGYQSTQVPMSMPMPQILQPPPLPPRKSSAFPPACSASGSSGFPSYTQSQANSQYMPESRAEIDKWMNSLIETLVRKVKDTTRTDLQLLYDNEDKINDLVKDAEQTKNLKKTCKDLAALNKDLALSNLSLKPELQVLKNRLLAQGEEQNQLKSAYLSYQDKMVGQSMSLDTVLALLQAATSEVEAESESVSQEFLEKKNSVDEFLDKFVKRRTTYHLRKLKSEKMAELLNRGPGRSASSQSLPAAGGGGGFGRGRPYP